MKRIFGSWLAMVLALLLGEPSAHAVVFGQLDDFEDGSTFGWSNGPFAVPITNVTSGGPAGVNDNYMQITSDGSGGGGRLTTFNVAQWPGNYLAAGVTTIELDLINQGATNLSIRLAFKPFSVQNSPAYLSPAMLLSVGSGWQHFSIAITAANLIPVAAPTAFNTFFSSVGEVRIINEIGATNANGDPIVGQLGVDNIRAIPEPAGAILALFGSVLLGATVALGRRRMLS